MVADKYCFRSIKKFAGFCALASVVISCTSIYKHFKHYSKPADQRLIVRIQLLLPLYALSSWLGLTSERGSAIVAPFQEIYEAVVIYTFFTLLTNILGGERNVVIMTMGRAPKNHPFPFNNVFPKVDISDPYTFLSIKRGILQYVWLKPILCLSIIIMKATGTYKEHYMGLTSGYMWLGIIYNVSISVSLYCLALFWYCLLDDLKPYRPLPKFLCIKAIIFFSYWQGVLLAILVLTGFIHDVGYYTPDNIATAIQNTLMCIEMLGFAIGHWHAFTYKDFESYGLMGYARLPMTYAIRDTFGIMDLVIDFKTTFYGSNYNYREFNSIETVLEHPESTSRGARLAHGMRYKAGGASKYWLPQQGSSSEFSNVRENYAPINTQETKSLIQQQDNYRAYGGVGSVGSSQAAAGSSDSLLSSDAESNLENTQDFAMSEEEMIEDDKLYKVARSFLYGDFNYPVITVQPAMEYRPIMQDTTRDQVTRSLLEQEYEAFDSPSISARTIK